jgi:hypothetical protein
MATMIKQERSWKAMAFGSFTEFLEYAETPPSHAHKVKCGLSGGGGYSWQEDNREFHGNNKFEEAIAEARQGWQTGVDKMAALRRRLDRLTQAASNIKSQSVQFGLGGEWLDVGRYLQGSPECWACYVDSGEDRASKVVQVKINISCSGSLSESTIFARGAVCLAAVDLIETMGHRVELTIGSCARGDDGRYEWQVVAKRPSDPLDVDRLTYFLCHPSGLRRFGFSCYEKMGRVGFGTPSPMIGHDEAGCVYIPHCVSDSDWGPATLEHKVIGMCKEAGISFSDEALAELVGLRR